MAENVHIALEAQPREIVGKKVKQLRNQGIVPITVYGPKIEPINLQSPYRPLELALRQAGGTTLIDLTVDGDTHTVIARQVQRSTLRGEIIHVDFFAIDLTQKIRADIPVHLEGESPIVQAKAGILITGANTVTVEVLPDKLMHEIGVDLSGLVNLGDAIHVRDLHFGEDVTVISDPDEMIVRVSQTSAARAEEEEVAAAAEVEVATAEPEVIKKGKEETEGEEE